MAGTPVAITGPGGERFGATLDLPPSGRGPGLVLLHDCLGVNRPLRAAAALFAEEGYAVLAPDLFWRLQPGTDLDDDAAGWQKGRELVRRCDLGAALADVGAALAALRERPECDGPVGVVGFGLGGLLAHLAAGWLPVGAAVAFGGAVQAHLGEAARLDRKSV